MVLSTRLCLAGIVIFGVPLVFIVQNAINSIKLARTNDPRINTRWISVIMAIVNVIACLVILAVVIGLLIILINNMLKPSSMEPLGYIDSSLDSSAVASSLTDDDSASTEVVAAALASSSPSDTDVVIGRDSIIPKDSLVIQRDGNLFIVDDDVKAKDFLNAVKKLKENDTLKILTKRSSS